MDDNAVLRQAARSGLNRAGFLVAAVGDGEEALEQLRRSRFDVAVVDVILPRRDGIGVIDEIRRHWPDTRVVAISGGGAIEPRSLLRLAERAGADASLLKPFQTRRLLSLINQLTAPPADRPS